MAGDVTNQTQRRLLEALGRYRLLSPAHMLRVGVGTSLPTIRREAAVLERKSLVGYSPPFSPNRSGSLPGLYWLTDHGAELLDEDPGGGPYGARREMGHTTHVTHRIKTVEAHIALREWAAEAKRHVGWFLTDFEPGSGGREKPTTIHYEGGQHGTKYTPDALAEIDGPDGFSRILAYEIERNRRQGTRLWDFRQKLKQLREVSGGRVVEARFELDKIPGSHSVKFVVIFAKAATREKILAGWPEPGAPEWKSFFVKSEDELADFNGGWWRPGGASRRPLFPFGPAAQPQTKLPLPVA